MELVALAHALIPERGNLVPDVLHLLVERPGVCWLVYFAHWFAPFMARSNAAFMAGSVSSIQAARLFVWIASQSRDCSGQRVISSVPRSPGFCRCQWREPGYERSVPRRRIVSPWRAAIASISVGRDSSGAPAARGIMMFSMIKR